MYITRFTFFPEIGRNQELRSQLEHWVSGSPVRGVESCLTTRLFASSACFTISIRHKNLGVYERYVQARYTNPEFQLFTARLITLITRSNTSELYEEVVAYSSDVPQPRYVQHVVHHPALGMDTELRRVLTEWAQAGMHTDGVGVAVTARLMSGDGNTLVHEIGYPSLSTLDHRNEARSVDPGFATFNRQRVPLVSRPWYTELEEVLVPYHGH